MPASIPTARSRRRATRCGGATGSFAKLDRSYGGFIRVVRGFERAHAGIQTSQFTASIDGGCGFGGPLIAACFDKRGDVVELDRGMTGEA